jgi:hypothetical protein
MTVYLVLSCRGRELFLNGSFDLNQSPYVFIPNVSLSSAGLQGPGVKVANFFKAWIHKILLVKDHQTLYTQSCFTYE